MPGSIQNAAPASVMPDNLSRAFAHEREYPAIDNEYRNGESQRSVQAANSRKRWRVAKRLRPAALRALRDFYDARKGPTEPFYFYDPYETNPKFSSDPAGLALAGRYTVRFAGEWQQSSGINRADCQIDLFELA